MPLEEIGEIRGKSAFPPGHRLSNARRNCKVVAARVGIAMVPAHARPAVIVAYGPSLRDTWSNIAAEREAGAIIVTTSGAHDLLIDRGIVPDVHVEVDAHPHKAFFTRNSRQDVAYWLASCVDAAMIDPLVAAGRNVALWHAINNDDDFALVSEEGPDQGQCLIAGGGSVGCRAVSLMFVLGCRTFTLYGMDCSFAEDGTQHAGDHSGRVQNAMDVHCGGRVFKSSLTLIHTARGFMRSIRIMNKESIAAGEPGVELRIVGDGLLAAMEREAAIGNGAGRLAQELHKTPEKAEEGTNDLRGAA